MKRFNKLLCFMVVFVAVMSAFCTVSFAESPFNWTSKANMLTPVSGSASLNVNNNIYVFGGMVNKDGSVTDKVQVYNTTTNTWSYKTSLPTAMKSCYAVEINGIIYIAGGTFRDNTTTSKFLAYDISTDTWNTELASLPISLGGAPLAVIDGKIYAFGGYNHINGHQSNIYIYDPSLNTWTKNSVGLNFARQQMGLSIYDGMVFLIGGWDANGASSIVEVFNPKTNTCTFKAPLKIARTYTGTITYGGNIYVLGGRTSIPWDATDIIEKYNIQSDTWTDIGKLSYSRSYPGVALIENSVYIFGGTANLNTLIYNTTEENIFPKTPSNLIAIPGNKKVDLSWTVPTTGSAVYNIKRSTTLSGPYETITTTSAITYTDNDVTNGTTYYYVVSAIVDGVESPKSNEVSATPTGTEEPPVITGNKAILEIVMTNGTIKEYDLTAQEMENFLTWYDNRSEGADKAYISIIKRSNVKPFVSRNEYLQFKEIYSFEVKEYKE
ncbi:Kelch repeat-containing protein [Ruminiclostridium cellobioparum]|uniref:Kelch repeat-containing protein n=1 Tax=Ruminiclostridium cellobioparum subsp. termitidis CT1112 TaxID=1195236 RepID=S0FJ88_RUMCE|nr:kelch repeat-containing protein [Ruminiclostridium cellobioparum]EMS72170.1 kelch repeat-containing protein [Ruminiclostridium cellobioparum subsp. termitidis CT1112]